MTTLPRTSIAALAAALALAACGSNSRTETPSTKAPRHMKAPKATSTPTPANPMVGGAEMYPTKTIVENASAASNLTTLVAAVKAAGLDTTLAGPGPFTVFAPNNAAFGRLAPGTVDTLMKPENKPSLVKLLQYHVVSGMITTAQLKAQIAVGGGQTMLTTVEGEPLTVTLTNGVITLTDANGNKSYVQTPDVMQSNGIVDVVNGVLVPKMA